MSEIVSRLFAVGTRVLARGVKRLKRLYWASRSRVYRAFGVRTKHLVVCGYPRSGTSLLYNMLSTSLRGFAFDDFEQWSADTIKMYGNHASKVPFDIFNIEQIASHNLHQKEIIALVSYRDIRDMITSVHPNVPTDYFIGYEASYHVRGQYPHYRTTFDAPGIGAIFAEIEALRDLGEHQLALIRYEELVTDPDAIQERLAERFGLSFQRKFSEFHLQKDKHSIKYEGRRAPLDGSLVKSDKKVTKDYIGRWKLAKHRQRVIQQFTEYPQLFTILRAYGYEQDDEWFQQLMRSSGVADGEVKRNARP